MAQIFRIGRIIAGFTLLGLGIIGLFLPVLQGVAMIVGGLLLLAPEFRWARWVLTWAKRRWQSVRRAAASQAGKADQ